MLGRLFKNFLYGIIKKGEKMDEHTEKIYQMIGNNIYRFRALEHLSQAQLAEKSQISAAYVSQIECFRLHKGITCTAVIRIAEALNVPACVLLAQEPCPKYLQCLEKVAAYPSDLRGKF